MENSDSQKLLFSETGKQLPQCPRPETLRRVYSLSCSMLAREFFRLLRAEGIRAVLDIRENRTYRGWWGFSSSEEDFRYLCELHDIVYFVVESLAPSKAMRSRFARDFKDGKRESDRDPNAWTEYLQQYQALLHQRRPLRSSPLHDILYGDFEAVAIVCSCRHHDDCHRSFAAGMIATLLPEVELKVIYQDGLEPLRASPRRYRFQDFPWAGLKANAPHRRQG